MGGIIIRIIILLESNSCMRYKAFTLIELLVVVSIISLLSAIGVASLNSARSKARYAKAISDMKAIGTAVQLYYDANGSWPRDTNQDTDRGAPTATPVTAYLSSWPMPSCAGWVYDYYYEGSWRHMVQVNLLNASSTALTYNCIQVGDIPGLEFCNAGSMKQIFDLNTKAITCSETTVMN